MPSSGSARHWRRRTSIQPLTPSCNITRPHGGYGRCGPRRCRDERPPAPERVGGSGCPSRGMADDEQRTPPPRPVAAQLSPRSPFYVSEAFSGRAGVSIDRHGTLADCAAILAGSHDHRDPQTLYLRGRPTPAMSDDQARGAAPPGAPPGETGRTGGASRGARGARSGPRPACAGGRGVGRAYCSALRAAIQDDTWS